MDRNSQAVLGPVEPTVRPLLDWCPCGDADCDTNRTVAKNATVAWIEALGLPVAAYEASATVQIAACKQRDGSRLWAVRDNTGLVLNKQGEWEHEPQPSSRDDAFLARCRYSTPLEARDAFMRYLAA